MQHDARESQGGSCAGRYLRRRRGNTGEDAADPRKGGAVEQDNEQHPGYGLKFLDLEPASKRKVLDLVRTNNILSFIPKG